MRLVDRKTGEALQNLGYDGDYNHVVSRDGLHYWRERYMEGAGWTPTPRLDDVAYWLRERHGIDICIDPCSSYKGSYRYVIYTDGWSETGVDMQASKQGRGYEAALADAVSQGIKIVQYQQEQEQSQEEEADCTEDKDDFDKKAEDTLTQVLQKIQTLRDEARTEYVEDVGNDPDGTNQCFEAFSGIDMGLALAEDAILLQLQTLKNKTDEQLQ